MNVIFTQIHAKKGMKLFGEWDAALIIKQLKQLYEGSIPRKPVVFPLNPNKLTDAERRQTL